MGYFYQYSLLKILKSLYYQGFYLSNDFIVKDLKDLKVSDPMLYEILKDQYLHSMAVAQLTYDGRDLGFIGIDNPDPEKFDVLKVVMEMLKTYGAQQVHDHHIIKRLETIGYRDRLTKAGNRHSLFEVVDRLDHSQDIGVIYLMLDDLKAINAKKGHTAGDTALVRMANILLHRFGAANVFRIGGDEFVVLRTVGDEAEMKDLLRRARNDFGIMGVHVSAGAVWKESFDGDFPTLMNLAYKDMIEPKQEETKVGIIS